METNPRYTTEIVLQNFSGNLTLLGNASENSASMPSSSASPIQKSESNQISDTTVETIADEFDDEIQAFRLDRILKSAMRYPANYGFIPSTLGEDGDPIDMLTYNWTPMAMGCVVRCHVIGVLEMEDDGEMDWKVIGRPVTSYKKSINDIHNINESFLEMAKNFFQHYKDLEGKAVKIGNWLPKDKATQIIKESIERYNDNKNVLEEVHMADFLDSLAKSSPSGESKTKAKPTRGKAIKIGKIGRFNITKYKYIYLKIK